jgi:hypothetical protein
MKTRLTVSILAAATAILLLSVGQARATLLESWENTSDPTFDGWTTNLQPYTPAYSLPTGATDGLASLSMTGTASPSYGQMLRSSFVGSYTSAFANASALKFDILTPPASFGFFLQFDVDINNSDLGFTSLDGFSYPATTIGAETTITVPVSAAINATLAASANPTQLIFQVGGGSNGSPQTFYIDNIRTVDIVPEPASATLLGLGMLGTVAGTMVRRRRANQA